MASTKLTKGGRKRRKRDPFTGAHLNAATLGDLTFIKGELARMRPDCDVTGSDAIRYALHRTRKMMGADVTGAVNTLHSAISDA